MKTIVTILSVLLATGWTLNTSRAQNPPLPVAPKAPEPVEPDDIPPQVPDPPQSFDVFTTAGDWGQPVPAANRSLVITKDTTEPKSISEVEEDLNVMAHILDKVVSGREERGRNVMGLVVRGGGPQSSAAPRNLYLEGYGAVFFLGVNYPLVPSHTKKAEEDSKEDVNSEWEQARRELSQPNTQPLNFIPQNDPFNGPPGEQYDPAKVDKLKADLIVSLKNASHIRRLKPEENVIVVVSGRGNSAGPPGRVIRHAGNHSVAMAFLGGGAGGAPESNVPRLIMRLKKSDLDAWQREKGNPDDLRKRVSVTIY